MKVYEPSCWIWDDVKADTDSVKNMGLFFNIDSAKDSLEKIYQEKISGDNPIVRVEESKEIKDREVYRLIITTKKYEFNFKIMERDVI